MNIVTGYRGEAHITSAQDRAGNQGSYGTGSYVLDVGNKLAATTASANEIRISDGAISHQGCIGVIEKGTYDSCAIANGSQGLNRIDRIVARYTRDSDTNVESLELVVIQGTAVSGTPSAPAYNTGDIQNGDSPVDMPLYQVRLSGVAVSSVTREFSYVKTQAELMSDVEDINADISTLNSDYFAEGFNTPVTASTGTTIYNRSISAGVWLVISYMAISVSSNSVYNHTLRVGANLKTVRTTCVNGGGSLNGTIVSLSQDSTITVEAYIPVNCNASGSVNAIKLT